jgi:hydroxymethylpyrimidine pyrophosphatase-like HAD family hydrolase
MIARTIFGEKLTALPATIDLCSHDAIIRLAAALAAGQERRSVAVGSGGSLAAAHYLANCRKDVSRKHSAAVTPMEFVLGSDDLSDAQVWLFTGRGENVDIAAALRAADMRGAVDVRVVTCNPTTPMNSYQPAFSSPHFHYLPVADEKDGFLSTHSLVTMVAHLLLATDFLLGVDREKRDGAGATTLLSSRLSDVRRTAMSEFWAGSLKSADTMLILADPYLTAASVCLETSLWETAICAPQRTDFRNFAHGRHIWPARRPDDTLFLALTSQHSRLAWSEIDSYLPAYLRRETLDYGSGGRLQAAIAVMDSLLVIEAMGNAVGIDPGKPGAGSFAKSIYEGRALGTTSAQLNAPVRHKYRAASRLDGAEHDYSESHASFYSALARQTFRALVLDYDGTIVDTNDRYQPPAADVALQLVRLVEGGIILGIATGRGGSAGDALRRVLPGDCHSRVLMGYYNGGYVQPLDVDIENTPAPLDPAIGKLADLLGPIVERFALKPRVRGVQIAADIEHIEDLAGLLEALMETSPLKSGELRMTRSHHSIDIIPAASSKLTVLRELDRLFAVPPGAILCVGDSGHAIGNDYELLGHPAGLSVDQVCHRTGACWAPFGSNLTGPRALLRILASLEDAGNGEYRLQIGGIEGSILP